MGGSGHSGRELRCWKRARVAAPATLRAGPYKTYTFGSAIAARTCWLTLALCTGGGLGGATKNHEAHSATRQAMPRSSGASGGTSSSSVVGQVTVGKGS